MFLHNFKFELLSGLRVKDVLIWLILFPIALGTCFKVAFSSVYENTMVFEPIKVAVVTEEEALDSEIFKETVTQVKNGKEKLFKAKFCDRKTAQKMLKDEKVGAVIYIGDKISMTTASSGMSSTVVKAFLDQYIHSRDIIVSAMESGNTENYQNVMKAISDDTQSVVKKQMTHGNTDMYIQYFYNLVAMVALYGSISGLHIAVGGQANLSALGARKNVSPTPKLIQISASLCATFVLEAICIVIAVTYTRFVLGIDYGDRLGLVYLASVIGGCLGVSLGFMVGSIGRMSENVKVALSNAVSLGLCFFSGLMDGGMKAKVELAAPWFNRINPAALLSDSLYCLNVYEDLSRFWEKVVSMVVITVILTLLGFIMTRRRRYASV